ncbi:hypothetical protein D3C79_851570 [compost metagenome]
MFVRLSFEVFVKTISTACFPFIVSGIVALANGFPSIVIDFILLPKPFKETVNTELRYLKPVSVLVPANVWGTIGLKVK